MEALDGNAIGGELHELYGREMTTARGKCRHCGAVAQIAELTVFVRAPGSVVRCRSCGNVVIVLISVHGVARIDLGGFELAGAPCGG
jgi:ribosomal protein S27E